MDASALRQQLAYLTGTEHYHCYARSRFTYTDGVAFLVEHAGAHWLLDVVFSHQIDRTVSCEPFQVWKLTVKDGAGVITCTDGGRDGNEPREIARQVIEYTDFPLDHISLWLEGTVLILPSEH